MGETAAAGGPDLAAGVALSEVPEGGILAGHVGEEAVLLYRQGEEVTAVGGTCTHYSGPLAEGVVQGDQVRCPWHHACFSLRTGQALRAPALNPLPRWQVRVDDGQVRVGGKLETPAYPPRRSGGAGGRVVVIGFGAAGCAAVECLLREGWSGGIEVVEPDRDAPYDRPNLSKDYLAGTAPEEWIPLRPAGWYEERGVTVHRVEASGIDVGARAVTLADGRRLPYDALLLATGAAPVRLRLPISEVGEAGSGGDASGPVPPLLYLRSLADSRALIAAAEGARRAVVLGASFIGLEVAASLRARGLEVEVVAPEAVPLERVLGKALGERIRALHEQHGVRFHLGHTASALAPGGVVLDDGSRLAAELVVAGVGVKPELRLAETAGLEQANGVLVDGRMRTSAPGVWAAGDIARYPDPVSGDRVRVEHWVVAERQGAAAARDIMGLETRPPDPAFFWSQHYDVPVNYVGHAERWDDVMIEGDVAGECAVSYLRDGRLLALATVYRDRESLHTEIQMERASDAQVGHA